jgi:hypothetical protein
MVSSQQIPGHYSISAGSPLDSDQSGHDAGSMHHTLAGMVCRGSGLADQTLIVIDPDVHSVCFKKSFSAIDRSGVAP